MPEVKQTPEDKAAEKKALADKKAAELKAKADKAAADKAAADKKKAELAKQQQAKKPVPKKPSPYLPFEALGEFTNNKVLCNARFAPCGKFVVAGGTTGAVHRWELVDAKPEPADAPTPLEFKPMSDLAGHGGWIQCVVFASKGNRVFTADSWGKLAAWDYTATEAKPVWEHAAAHGAWIRNVAVSHDGKLVATASRDGLVRLWDAATGKQVAELSDHKEDVYSVAFSPDDKTLVSGDFMGKIKLWDVATRKCTRELDGDIFAALERLQDCGGVRILQFIDGGKTLVAAGAEPTGGGTFQGYPTIAVYDLADAKSDGKPKKTVKFGETKDGFVTDFVVCPSGDWMLVTSGVTGNGKLMLLKANEDKPYVETTKLSNTHACSLHPDGKRFIVTCCNPNNSGNGAVKSKESMDYVSNWSPVRLLELPAAGPTA